MGMNEKKMHSNFHFFYTNVSWLKIGGTNFGSPDHDHSICFTLNLFLHIQYNMLDQLKLGMMFNPTLFALFPNEIISKELDVFFHFQPINFRLDVFVNPSIDTASSCAA